MNIKSLWTLAKNKIKGLLYAPPSQDWMEEQLSGGLHHLMGSQISKIARICREEAKKSASFGFIMRDKDLLQEAAVYLVAFDRCAGTGQFQKQFSFEAANKLLGELIDKMMKKEIAYYREKAAEEGRVLNEINCHLESVLARILKNLFNERLSPWDSWRNPTPIF